MNRQDILEAAAQIFSVKGYHAASMQNIAQSVNLQKASLYHHVSSKEEILFDLLGQGLDLLTGRMEAVIAAPIPVDDKLRKAMAVYLHTLTEHRDLAAVLLLEHRSLSPRLRAEHILRRDRFEALWQQLIREGLDGDQFDFPDAGLAAKALLGVMNWTITWYRPDGSMKPSEIADRFADLFLDGMRGRENLADPS